ncbi:MAG: type VI secretion system baseplate subunit TssE [Desulfovibrionaceae bacterium]|nr:type VI secretion system baseplate subunit TssE [Desulfovibrionaceae bacterium]
MEGRLLERIMNAERPGAQQQGNALTRHVSSVGSYLGRLLNTRQGSTAIAPDMGLPDITNFAHVGGEEVETLENLMESIIARYEPRLHDVQVKYKPESNSAFSMAFSLSAKVDNEGTLVPVLFETILLPDGRIEIRGYA